MHTIGESGLFFVCTDAVRKLFALFDIIIIIPNLGMSDWSCLNPHSKFREPICLSC